MHVYSAHTECNGYIGYIILVHVSAMKVGDQTHAPISKFLQTLAPHRLIISEFLTNICTSLHASVLLYIHVIVEGCIDMVSEIGYISWLHYAVQLSG